MDMMDRILRVYHVFPWLYAGQFLYARGDQVTEFVRSNRIKAILDLTRPGEQKAGGQRCDPYLHHLPEGIWHFRVASPNGEALGFFDLLRCALIISMCCVLRRRLYVHCHAGVGRTGSALLAGLILMGYGFEESRDWLQQQRVGLCLDITGDLLGRTETKHGKPSPRKVPQLQAVLDFYRWTARWIYPWKRSDANQKRWFVVKTDNGPEKGFQGRRFKWIQY